MAGWLSLLGPRAVRKRLSKHTARQNRFYTYFQWFLMIFVVFLSTAGWPAKSRDGRYGKPKTHIFPMDFDDCSNIGVPKTSKLLENHWFCKVFQPSGGSKRASGAGKVNWTGGTRRAHRGYSYSYILLRVAVLTRHLRGCRIEDACGDVTGHPFVKL